MILGPEESRSRRGKRDHQAAGTCVFRPPVEGAGTALTVAVYYTAPLLYATSDGGADCCGIAWLGQRVPLLGRLPQGRPAPKRRPGGVLVHRERFSTTKSWGPARYARASAGACGYVRTSRCVLHNRLQHKRLQSATQCAGRALELLDTPRGCGSVSIPAADTGRDSHGVE